MQFNGAPWKWHSTALMVRIETAAAVSKLHSAAADQKLH